MSYIVTVDDKKFKIDIEKEANNFKVSLNGNPLKVTSTEMGNSHLSLIIDNKHYDIIIDKENIIVNGETFRTKVEDERFAGIALKKKSVETGKINIKAPIPGLVVEILAKEGDVVKANDGLVILEAMKMQNELKAPRNGIIKQVFITQGMSVNGGDTLFVIE